VVITIPFSVNIYKRGQVKTEPSIAHTVAILPHITHTICNVTYNMFQQVLEMTLTALRYAQNLVNWLLTTV